MKRLAILSIFFSVVAFALNAQLPNTSNWINFSNPYYRISVGKDGVYRVKKSDLKDIGAPTETISNDAYQVFVNGKEIPINVTSNYIEFYAERAKGDIDSLLYEKSSDQLGKGTSQYLDSAYYYLTYGNTKGLRFTPQTNTNVAGLSKVEYHNKQVRLTYNDYFYYGERPNGTLLHPGYGAGDGWGSARCTRNVSVNDEFDISDYYADGNFKTTVVGINNRVLDAEKYDGYSNQVLVSFNNGSWKEMDRKLFAGWVQADVNFDFTSSDFANDVLKFSVSHDPSYNGIRRAFKGQFNLFEVEVNYKATTRINNGTFSTFEIPSSSSAQNLEISNINGSTVFIYDVENKFQYNYDFNGSIANVRLAATSNNPKIVVATDKGINLVKPVEVTFNEIDVSTSFDYLIITHRKFEEAVAEYADYRKSAKGGAYDVKVAYIDDIFNQFYFGYHHPMAIRLFLNELYQNNTGFTQVFLIGKALNLNNIKTNLGEFDLSNDLVPSIGSPCSDWYFGRNLQENTITPPFAIGRLSVLKSEEISNYLTKIKAYENLENSRWRKDVVHVSGGKSGSELVRFSNYMKSLGAIISEPSMGANVHYFGKEKGLVVDEDLKTAILKRINKGAGMFSYYGHAALNITEVDIGVPSEYNNANNPLVMYFGGCVLGGCFEKNGSLGEDFISANTGAVMWIAASTFSFETTVFDYTKNFYEKISGDSYGQTLGEISRLSVGEFLNSNGDIYKESQAWQTIIQGDPALRLYSPDYPDYTITDKDIFITPEDVTA
ncbi:MAG: C25 family cysteine peptidase, partial [Bacteroidia bacterium]